MEMGGGSDILADGEEAADRGLQGPLLHFCICVGNQPGVVVWIGKVGMVGVAVTVVVVVSTTPARSTATSMLTVRMLPRPNTTHFGRSHTPN